MDKSTHYFWSLARDHRLDEQGVPYAIQQAIAHTFSEDAVILGIQQRLLDWLGRPIPRVALRVGEAPIRTRRQLEALILR